MSNPATSAESRGQAATTAPARHGAESPAPPVVGSVSPEAHATVATSARPRFTRTSATWVAIASSLAVLIVLIVFILQNLTSVEVAFLGWAGSVPLGMALLLAAVAGGVVVAIAGVARLTQLRVRGRRARRGHGRV